MSVYVGIDWSTEKHDVVFLNEGGAVLGQLTMAHTPVGLSNLEKTRQYLGVARAECVVGLETAHTRSVVIDFLWACEYPQIYVIPPSVIKGCRGRYGQSGARDDRQDGWLIADVVRTDRARLYPWNPDSLLTRQLRAIVGRTNRLRAVLLRYYPAALVVFGRLAGPITLQFLLRYPTPGVAQGLTYLKFKAFAQETARLLCPTPSRPLGALSGDSLDLPGRGATVGSGLAGVGQS